MAKKVTKKPSKIKNSSKKKPCDYIKNIGGISEVVCTRKIDGESYTLKLGEDAIKAIKAKFFTQEATFKFMSKTTPHRPLSNNEPCSSAPQQ